MLVLGLLAGIAAVTPPASATAVRASNRVSVRIVRGARVERGQTEEPHSRGQARVIDPGQPARVISVVEFH